MITPHTDLSPAGVSVDSRRDQSGGGAITGRGGAEGGPVMTVYCSIKQPEIVMLADPSTVKSRILVINVSLTLENYCSVLHKSNLGVRGWCPINFIKPFDLCCLLLSFH